MRGDGKVREIKNVCYDAVNKRYRLYSQSFMINWNYSPLLVVLFRNFGFNSATSIVKAYILLYKSEISEDFHSFLSM